MKDAIEYLLYMKHDVHAKSPMDIAIDTAIEVLKQPTIEAEPVRNGRWIPCSDRMPKTGTPVLCYCPAYRENKYNAAYWDGDWFIECYSEDQLEQVTHWMQLPEPPKSEV